VVGFAVGLHLLACELVLCYWVDAVLELDPQCVTVFADGGDVSFGPSANQYLAEFAAKLVSEPELNRHGTVARRIDLAFERSAVRQPPPVVRSIQRFEFQNRQCHSKPRLSALSPLSQPLSQPKRRI
jgi:hypothetical protein